MSKEKTKVLSSIFTIIFLLALLIACEPEIEYREVIKEVPVEVIIEVPVVDESRINELINQLNNLKQLHDGQLLELENLYNAKLFELNNSNLENDILLQKIEELELAYQTKISELNDSFTIEKALLQNKLTNEANYQLNELRKYYDSELLQLNEAYNIKLEELNIAYADNNTLLLQIDELENKHKNQIDELNIIYNKKISELEELINPTKIGKVFHLRSYTFLDKEKWYSITNASVAKDLFCVYTSNMQMHNAYEVVILLDFNNQLENSIKESKYVKGDVDTIRRDMNKDEIAYGFYWEGDYVIQWFIVWQFYSFLN